MKIEKALVRIQKNDIDVVSGLVAWRRTYGGGKDGDVSRLELLPRLEIEELILLFEALAENTSVIELDLTENMYHRSSLFYFNFKRDLSRVTFIQALQRNQTIKIVNLSNNHLGNDLFLTDLKLSKKYLGVFINALEELVSIKRLKKLDLSKNWLTATHIEGLCRSLGGSNLEVLNLSKNKLKDEGVRMVLSALADHHCLKELIIHGNGISKAFLKEIPSLVEHIPGLKHIELGAKLKLPWNKALRKDIDKKIEAHDGRLVFFQACNFLLMYWWRESNSPKSASPLAALPVAVITCILMQLRDAYEKTIPNKVIRARVREFTHEQNDTLCWNAYPEEEIKRPKLRKLEAIKAEQRTGVYNYALTANGQLFFGKKFAAPGGRHIDLVNGFPVRCAGEMRFKNGEMTEYDNASRHYQPSPTQAEKEMAFFLNAANEKLIKFTPKKWVEDKTPENGDEWVPATMKK